MFAIIGTLILVGSVFGGFAMAGGHLGALFQPLELLMIGGAAIGVFVAGNPLKDLKATFAALPGTLKGSKYNKAVYMELMALLYEILSKTRKEGLMSIERDVEAPNDSALFGKYPKVQKDHHLVEFITDYLRIMVSGNLNAFEIENLMDNEIDVHHQDGHLAIHALHKIADGLPAFGIIAAVMGVVHTMASVGLPPSELGNLIASALVGTFLGILLAYGVVSPLASLLERKLAESTKVYQCVKVTIIASLNGYAPMLAVEFGRKVVSARERPSFAELEQHCRQLRKR